MTELRELIDRWRQRAANVDSEYGTRDRATHVACLAVQECADELESALALIPA